MSRFSEHDRRVYAYLVVRNHANGIAKHLSEGDLIITSARDKGAFAKDLDSKRGDVAWDRVIDEACGLVIREYWKGEPVLKLGNLPMAERQRWQLWPVAPMGQCTVIFGEGGSAKTTLAVAMCLAVQTGWAGLKLGPSVTNGLYLDWETDPDTMNDIIREVKAGAGLLEAEIDYLYCTQPLVRMLPQLQRHVAEKKIGFVVVDSAVAALSGEAKEAQTHEIFNALRALKVTSLILTHQSKTEDGRKTPYGSIFFWNRARAVWEIRKNQNIGEDSIEVGLFHRKSNRSKLFHSLGYKLTFGNGMIQIDPTDVKAIPALAAGLHLRDRIRDLLEAGPFSEEEIVKELQADKDQVHARLYELRKNGLVEREGKDWLLQ